MQKIIAFLVLALLLAPAAAMAGEPVLWVDIVYSQGPGPSPLEAKLTVTGQQSACTPKEGVEMTTDHDGGLHLPAACKGQIVDVAYQQGQWNCTGSAIVQNDNEVVLTCD
ncbi:MAG: hypothetical protein ACOCVM_08290 [Desulfovibrionaceae bacterium]